MSCPYFSNSVWSGDGLEVYEVDRLDFAEAYLVGQAEATGVDTILFFDKSIDRVSGVTRHEP